MTSLSTNHKTQDLLKLITQNYFFWRSILVNKTFLVFFTCSKANIVFFFQAWFGSSYILHNFEPLTITLVDFNSCNLWLSLCE